VWAVLVRFLCTAASAPAAAALAAFWVVISSNSLRPCPAPACGVGL